MSELERRTPLKRSGNLRRTPMKRSASREPRARPANRGVEFSEKTRRRAASRYGGMCALCDRLGYGLVARQVEQYHHRQMRSAGGRGTVENCLPLCGVHHRLIHGYPDWAYRHGLLVKRHADPSAISVVAGCAISCEVDHVGQ